MQQGAIAAGLARGPHNIGVIPLQRRGKLKGKSVILHGGENNLLVVSQVL